jgi:hypothetical protein
MPAAAELAVLLAHAVEVVLPEWEMPVAEAEFGK